MRGFNSEQRQNLRSLLEEKKTAPIESFNINSVIQDQSILSRVKKPTQANGSAQAVKANSIFSRIKTNNDNIEFDRYDLEGDEEDEQPLVIKLQKPRVDRLANKSPYSIDNEPKLIIKRQIVDQSSVVVQRQIKNAPDNASLIISKSIQQVEKPVAKDLNPGSLEIEVLNIPDDATEENLKRFFLAFGRIASISIDKKLKKADVVFLSKEGQDKAIQMANQKQLGDSIITVQTKQAKNAAVKDGGLQIKSGMIAAFAQENKQGQEQPKSKLMDVTLENQKKVFMDEEGVKGTWFAIFEDKKCKECRKYVPEINHLADIVPPTTKVGRINCQYTVEVCKILGISEYPSFIYFTGNKAHIYKGEVKAQLIQDNFLNNNKYQKAQLFSGDVKKTIMEGLERIMPTRDLPRFPIISELLMFVDAHCGRTIGFIFFKLGKDHWRRETKAVIFSLLAFGPFIAFFIKGFLDCCCKKKIQKK